MENVLDNYFYHTHTFDLNNHVALWTYDVT